MAAGFEDYRNWGKIQYISETMVDNFCEEILSYGLGEKPDFETYVSTSQVEVPEFVGKNEFPCKENAKKNSQDGLKVVYSPLNGAGRLCMMKVLNAKGIKDIHIVEEQREPDGNFPTCPYPNPEDDKAMELGIKLCEETGADIFLATDPDSDRVGVVAKKGEQYLRLNGNQAGVLLLDYILTARKNNRTLPEKPVVIKTIVTTEMAERIAADFGAEVINTLTGFKYIGEQIGELEQKGETDRFVFGLESIAGSPPPWLLPAAGP